MIFCTHFYMPDGTKWSGPRLTEFSWDRAEVAATFKGVEVTGRLHAEIDEETGRRIDYDLIEAN